MVEGGDEAAAHVAAVVLRRAVAVHRDGVAVVLLEQVGHQIGHRVQAEVRRHVADPQLAVGVAGGRAQARRVAGRHFPRDPGRVRGVLQRGVVGQRQQRQRARRGQHGVPVEARQAREDRPGAGLGLDADPVVDGVGLAGVCEQAGREGPFGLVVVLQLFQEPAALVEQRGAVLVALQGVPPHVEGALGVARLLAAQARVDRRGSEVGLVGQRRLEGGPGLGAGTGGGELDAEVVPGGVKLAVLVLRLGDPAPVQRDRAEFAVPGLQRVDDVDDVGDGHLRQEVAQLAIALDRGAVGRRMPAGQTQRPTAEVHRSGGCRLMHDARDPSSFT